MTEQRTFTTAEVAALVRRNLFGWMTAAAIVCVYPAIRLAISIPQAEALFKGFGADLPGSTRLVLDWPLLVLILPTIAVVLIVVALTAPASRAIGWHQRLVTAIAVVCCLSMLANGLCISALFAPILALGAVV